ncbi:MAG: lipid-A-disaccharide synthase [Bdellovibrionales bacterium]|nr:lipid-A-disaccharide synthase [Bdellovibrionales bacterium]
MQTSPSDCSDPRILIVAAEASSCMYACRFIEQWHQRHPEWTFFGIGDRKMQSMGMNCFGFAEDLAVVGLLEVIKHWGDIKGSADRILAECEKRKPQFALLLDYPGFNLRLAKKLHQMNIPVVYYISPQLWAWKKGRVRQVKDFVDDMMVVFPFEVDFYQSHGVQAHFVGHPLVEVVEDENIATEPSQGKRVLGLMPGSRKSEIQYNFQEQVKAAKLLQEQLDIDVKVLVAPTLDLKDLQAQCENCKFEFIQGPPTQMIQQCDVILAASGTATLQVALCEKPMVVMYRMNPITAFFAKRLVNTVEYFCIVNLIARRKLVEELFQGEARGTNLASALLPLLKDEKIYQSAVENLKVLKSKLGGGGATSNLVSYLEAKYL